MSTASQTLTVPVETAPPLRTAKKGGQLEILHAIRGVASVYVVMCHCRWLLLEPVANLRKADHWAYVLAISWAGFLHFGIELVMMFFVLSGFVIHLKYSRQVAFKNDGRIDSRDYLWRRIKRIYPGFLFSILFTFILDSIGRSLGLSFYQNATPYEVINVSFHFDFSWRTLATTVGFLFPDYGPVWGSNGPYWSLKFEWWFYLLYPLVFLINRRSPWAALALVIGAKMVTVGSGLVTEGISYSVLVLFDLWYMGVVLADIYTGRLPLTMKQACWGVVLMPLAIVQHDLHILPDKFWAYSSSLIWGIAWVGGLALAIRLEELYLPKRGWHVPRWAVWLGDISLSLYLLHCPVIVLLSAWLIDHHGHLPYHNWLMAPMTALSILLGWAGYTLVEKPFLKQVKRGDGAQRAPLYPATAPVAPGAGSGAS